MPCKILGRLLTAAYLRTGTGDVLQCRQAAADSSDARVVDTADIPCRCHRGELVDEVLQLGALGITWIASDFAVVLTLMARSAA
jgi:hypothetical protein